MAETLTFSKKMYSLEYWAYIILFITNITSWVCFLNWSSITLLTNPLFPFVMSVAVWEYLINILIFVSISMLAALISGIVADKTFNRLGLIVAGFALVSVGMVFLAYGLWHGYGYMLYANILVGCGFGMNISSLGAYFGDLTDPKDRGKIQGISVALGYLLAVGLLSIADIPVTIGIIITFMIIGISMGNYVAKKPNEKFDKEKNTTMESIPELFKNKNFFYYLISFMLFLIALPIINVLFEPIFGASVIDPAFLQNFFYIYYLLFVVLALVGGFAIDYGRKAVTLFLFLTLGFGFVVWGITPSVISVTYPFLIFISIFMILGNSLTNILDYTISADFAEPRSRGRLVSFFYIASSVGLIISTAFREIIELTLQTQGIATLALIITFLMLLSVIPIILATRSLDEALAKQVNVKGVFVVTQDGRCMVDVTFKGVSVETDLITGALSAVGDLIKESVHSEKRLKTIDQEDTMIMISYGEHVNACLIADKETVELRKKVDTFLKAFEEKYDEYIRDWTGALRPFMGAYKTIEEIFGIYA